MTCGRGAHGSSPLAYRRTESWRDARRGPQRSARLLSGGTWRTSARAVRRLHRGGWGTFTVSDSVGDQGLEPCREGGPSPALTMRPRQGLPCPCPRANSPARPERWLMTSGASCVPPARAIRQPSWRAVNPLGARARRGPGVVNEIATRSRVPCLPPEEVLGPDSPWRSRRRWDRPLGAWKLRPGACQGVRHAAERRTPAEHTRAGRAHPWRSGHQRGRGVRHSRGSLSSLLLTGDDVPCLITER